LLACVTGHAYEQDNWYIANEWSVPNSSSLGISYFENNSTSLGQVYICNGSGSSARVSVYNLNGSVARHITVASDRSTLYDVTLDQNGTIYISGIHNVTCLANDGTFIWRKGKGATASAYGSVGAGELEFNYPKGITIGPEGNLYVADTSNHRIQVLDKNGTYIKSIGTQGTAPGQFYYPNSIGFLPDGIMVVRDEYRLHWFNSDGSFIKRLKESDGFKRSYMAISPSGEIITWCEQDLSSTDGRWEVYLLDSYGSEIARLTHDTWTVKRQNMRYVFTPQGDLITSFNNQIEYKKRAFRTKGLPQRNVIPQPAIRKIAQRSGTNVLDLDFEIIDSDDTNATVGIMAYAENVRVVPQAWTDGTGSKIGTPIATNEVHRVSWDVKQDWNTSTGTIKFEILCQDGRTNKPVDVHFLTLPLADGNLTISRSPIKDTDIENYLKYLVAIGSNEVAYENSTITDGSGTIYLNASKQATAQGKTLFMTKLGHRWATATEVNNAKIAATPGTTNTWAASRQISPRGLPKNVNEYGFDTGNHGTRAWWVVKE
jgi:hypothetical protein